MKRLLLGLVLALGMLLGSWSGVHVQPVAAAPLAQAWQSPLLAEEIRNAVDDKLSTEYGSKLDLNNANVQAFVKYKGMYPTIAGKILKNAPYDTVDDVLKHSGVKRSRARHYRIPSGRVCGNATRPGAGGRC